MRKRFVFCWQEIPGKDNDRLIGYLKKKFGVNWTENAAIRKIDGGKTIRLSFEKNYIFLRLNDDTTKVNLQIDDGRTDELIAKKENDKLNIYRR